MSQRRAVGARCKILCKTVNGVLRFPFVEQKLRQLFDAIFIFRLARQQGAQHGFGLVVVVLQAVEPREPQRGVGIGGIEAQDFGILLGGARQRVLLRRSVTQIAQGADVDARQQAVRAKIFRIPGQHGLRFGHGVANVLGLEIDFGKFVADLLAGRIQRESFLVKIDGFVGVLGLAGDLVALGVVMAHQVVVIDFGRIGRGGGRALAPLQALAGRGCCA